MLAPIVVFVYNRVDKARTLLESLSACKQASESDLYVFSDGPKKDNDEKVSSVRDFLNSFDFKDKYKNVYIRLAPQNKGLARSVIEGVSEVIEKYGKVIVVEDDNIVAPDFLQYMNGALDYYHSNPSVWSISGYSHIKPENYCHDVYAVGRINSYAWATWKRSWDATDWEVKDYNHFKWDLNRRREFNTCGNDSSIMLDAQMAGAIDSWAIRFSFSMFCSNKLTIYPSKSKTFNIGEDGSGTHVLTSKTRTAISFEYSETVYEDVLPEAAIIKQFKKAVHRNLLVRVKYFIKHVVLGR